MNKRFVLWITWVSLTLLGFIFALKFNLVGLILAGDQTYLSYVILSLYPIVSVLIGYKIAVGESLPMYIDRADDVLVTLGLIGTFIGFGIMLSTNLSTDVSDAAEIKKILEGMSAGLGTALYTSIAGTICGLALRIQKLIKGYK